ncbi:hypothetical protein C8Q78DRAFT_446223 [Trametes maxima]|nr:hypothetical protein C8Q78DRAFT_446223 [Trametes maxima]
MTAVSTPPATDADGAGGASASTTPPNTSDSHALRSSTRPSFAGGIAAGCAVFALALAALLVLVWTRRRRAELIITPSTSSQLGAGGYRSRPAAASGSCAYPAFLAAPPPRLTRSSVPAPDISGLSTEEDQRSTRFSTIPQVSSAAHASSAVLRIVEHAHSPPSTPVSHTPRPSTHQHTNTRLLPSSRAANFFDAPRLQPQPETPRPAAPARACGQIVVPRHLPPTSDRAASPFSPSTAGESTLPPEYAERDPGTSTLLVGL